MGKSGRDTIFDQEKQRLSKLFEKADDESAVLAVGLIEQAAFLRAEMEKIQRVVNQVGSVVVNPIRPSAQRTTEAAKLLLKSQMAYKDTIKAITMILRKSVVEEEDEFEKFLEEQRQKAANDGA